MSSYSETLQPNREKAGTNTINQLFTSNERIYDTLLPNFANCLKELGNQILYFKSTTWNSGPSEIAYLPFENAGFIDLYNAVTEATSAQGWFYTFPYNFNTQRVIKIKNGFYSTRLHHLDVVFDPDQFNIPPKLLDTLYIELCIQETGDAYNIPKLICDLNLDITVQKTVFDDPDYVEVNAVLTSSLNEVDITKILFGFGDYNTFQLWVDSGRDYVGGYKYLASFRKNIVDLEGSFESGDYLKICPIIRGWKYGLYSGFPTYTKTYWRNNHYGYFRDMLEQRLDTKFYDETQNSRYSKRDLTQYDFNNIPRGQVLESPVKVKFVNAKTFETTNPENTWSCNLSHEATSSVPFFDGDLRNRTEIQFNVLNTSVVNVNVDSNNNITV